MAFAKLATCCEVPDPSKMIWLVMSLKLQELHFTGF